MSITFTDEMYRVDQVKSLLWKQIEDNPISTARFYAVLYYGRSYNGDTLPSDSLNDTPALKYPIVAPMLPVI